MESKGVFRDCDPAQKKKKTTTTTTTKNKNTITQGECFRRRTDIKLVEQIKFINMDVHHSFIPDCLVRVAVV